MRKFLALAVGMVFLASVGPSVLAEGPQPTMYTLDEIYYYLTEGILPAEGRPGLEPTSGVPGEDVPGFNKSLADILEDIRSQFEQCDITADDLTFSRHQVLTHDDLKGKTIFLTQSSAWGPYEIPSTPVPSPTPTPTPTPPIGFDYTGEEQEWVVPGGVTEILIEARGAQGGTGGSGGGYVGGTGGRGARVQAVLSVTPGETLYVYVGGRGGDGSGWPMGGGGGGASDIRQGGNAFENRVIVASGGGGGGSCGKNFGEYSGANGWNGGDGGENGGDGSDGNVQGGTGGTQTSGGVGGTYQNSYKGGNGGFTDGGGGDGGSVNNGGYNGGYGGIGGLGSYTYMGGDGGGGGAGYYGGGGGSGGGVCKQGGGGGGGSSWVDESVTTDTNFESGYQAGDGSVVIWLF